MIIAKYTANSYQNSPLTKVCDHEVPLEYAFKIGAEMIPLMEAEGGMGLAANQVGLLIPLIIVTIGGNPTILYKPQLLSVTTFSMPKHEGCLSFPGITVDINRPVGVEISAIVNEKGQQKTFSLDGNEARCFLHELDHLEGKTILSYQEEPSPKYITMFDRVLSRDEILEEMQQLIYRGLGIPNRILGN